MVVQNIIPAWAYRAPDYLCSITQKWLVPRSGYVCNDTGHRCFIEVLI